MLITAGVILAAGIFFLYRNKLKSIRTARANVRSVNQGAAEQREQEPRLLPDAQAPEGSPARGTAAPKFTTFQKRSGLGTDLLRALLIVLSLAVAAALVLTLLPQSKMDAIRQYLESRHRAAKPEKIAFLYLGDEMLDSQIHIRGAVRNITAAPIEQLDAVVRFYAQDRSLLETIIVRMDREIIGPNEIARFDLVYPNDRMGFAGYSAEFKLRQGAKVPYSDWRRMPVQAP